MSIKLRELRHGIFMNQPPPGEKFFVPARLSLICVRPEAHDSKTPDARLLVMTLTVAQRAGVVSLVLSPILAPPFSLSDFLCFSLLKIAARCRCKWAPSAAVYFRDRLVLTQRSLCLFAFVPLFFHALRVEDEFQQILNFVFFRIFNRCKHLGDSYFLTDGSGL